MRKLYKNYKFLILSFIIAPFLIIINLIQAVAQEGDKAVSKHLSDTPKNQEWGRIISLDGQWEVEEGNKQQVPSNFSATVPVPGLITSATPAFKNEGEEKSGDSAFWYRRKFTIGVFRK